jgi:hypothetical protein
MKKKYKIIAENFQILRKRSPSRYRRPLELHTDKTKIDSLHSMLLLKTLSTENNERILKAIREKHQVTYKGKPIRITIDLYFLKVRRAWNRVLQVLKKITTNLDYSIQKSYHS